MGLLVNYAPRSGLLLSIIESPKSILHYWLVLLLYLNLISLLLY